MILSEQWRKKIKIIIFFIFLFIFISMSYSVAGEIPTLIRIGIIENVSSVVIDDKVISYEGLVKDEITFGSFANKWIKVNNRCYRGTIEVRKNNKYTLTVINILNIEDYLYGVVKEEISPQWPKEAVKSQIVAARTFALKNLGKHKDKGFDLCAAVHCQVYGGVNSEDKVSNKYVDETRGEVITYKGKLIDAAYHGICGGWTEYPRNVWKGKERIYYLQSVRCNWCKDASGFSWKAKIPLAEIQSKLADNGISVGEIQNIRVFRKNRTGRAEQIKILGTKDSEIIDGNKLRFILGTNVIRSTMFEIVKKDKDLVFTGKGWGHGVGMCQEGARGMAKKGYNYKQIIRYYYRGVTIEKWRGK